MDPQKLSDSIAEFAKLPWAGKKNETLVVEGLQGHEEFTPKNATLDFEQLQKAVESQRLRLDQAVEFLNTTENVALRETVLPALKDFRISFEFLEQSTATQDVEQYNTFLLVALDEQRKLLQAISNYKGKATEPEKEVRPDPPKQEAKVERDLSHKVPAFIGKVTGMLLSHAKSYKGKFVTAEGKSNLSDEILDEFSSKFNQYADLNWDDFKQDGYSLFEGTIGGVTQKAVLSRAQIGDLFFQFLKAAGIKTSKSKLKRFLSNKRYDRLKTLWYEYNETLSQHVVRVDPVVGTKTKKKPQPKKKRHSLSLPEDLDGAISSMMQMKLLYWNEKGKKPVEVGESTFEQGSPELGTKTEVKNIFRAIGRSFKTFLAKGTFSDPADAKKIEDFIKNTNANIINYKSWSKYDTNDYLASVYQFLKKQIVPILWKYSMKEPNPTDDSPPPKVKTSEPEEKVPEPEEKVPEPEQSPQKTDSGMSQGDFEKKLNHLINDDSIPVPDVNAAMKSLVQPGNLAKVFGFVAENKEHELRYKVLKAVMRQTLDQDKYMFFCRRLYQSLDDKLDVLREYFLFCLNPEVADPKKYGRTNYYRRGWLWYFNTRKSNEPTEKKKVADWEATLWRNAKELSQHKPKQFHVVSSFLYNLGATQQYEQMEVDQSMVNRMKQEPAPTQWSIQGDQSPKPHHQQEEKQEEKQEPKDAKSPESDEQEEKTQKKAEDKASPFTDSYRGYIDSKLQQLEAGIRRLSNPEAKAEFWIAVPTRDEIPELIRWFDQLPNNPLALQIYEKNSKIINTVGFPLEAFLSKLNIEKYKRLRSYFFQNFASPKPTPPTPKAATPTEPVPPEPVPPQPVPPKPVPQKPVPQKPAPPERVPQAKAPTVPKQVAPVRKKPATVPIENQPVREMDPALQRRVGKPIRARPRPRHPMAKPGAPAHTKMEVLERRKLRNKRGRYTQFNVTTFRREPDISQEAMAQILRNDRLNKDPVSRFKGGRKKKIGKSVQLMVKPTVVHINIKKGASKRVLSILLKNIRPIAEQTTQAEFFVIKGETKLAIISRNGLLQIGVEQFIAMVSKYLRDENTEFVLEHEPLEKMGGSMYNRGEYLY